MIDTSLCMDLVKYFQDPLIAYRIYVPFENNRYNNTKIK
jgi:hypothetical protein